MREKEKERICCAYTYVICGFTLCHTRIEALNTYIEYMYIATVDNVGIEYRVCNFILFLLSRILIGSENLNTEHARFSKNSNHKKIHTHLSQSLDKSIIK